MMTPYQFITTARLWIGTPFHHQASVKGVGADCIGFPKGVIHAFGIDVSEVPSNYSRQSQPEILLEYLRKSTLVKEDTTKTLRIGCIALFFVYKEPHHFGIITGDGTWIHTDAKYGVVETPIGRWVERIHSVWIPTMLEEAHE